jgi:hypothetical protein
MPGGEDLDEERIPIALSFDVSKPEVWCHNDDGR